MPTASAPPAHRQRTVRPPTPSVHRTESLGDMPSVAITSRHVTISVGVSTPTMSRRSDKLRAVFLKQWSTISRLSLGTLPTDDLWFTTMFLFSGWALSSSLYITMDSPVVSKLAALAVVNELYLVGASSATLREPLARRVWSPTPVWSKPWSLKCSTCRMVRLMVGAWSTLGLKRSMDSRKSIN